MHPHSGNRWTHDEERPGSIFHELVVLPTVAPHLARPEYLDPTPGVPIVLPQPRSHQLEHGVTVVQGQRSMSMSLVFSNALSNDVLSVTDGMALAAENSADSIPSSEQPVLVSEADGSRETSEAGRFSDYSLF